MTGSPGLPRLLAGLNGSAPMPLARHLEIHGPLPAASRRRGDAALALVSELERARLRGRGGGAFPAATKLVTAASSRGRSVLVVNGCEGEPLSFKDRLLLERFPHLVLDGAALAARAARAEELFIAVDELASRALGALDHALRERPDLPRGCELVSVPTGYVSGQESALVNYLNGGPAKPLAMLTPIYERGVRGRPTMVSNVETLAHLALIARHGAGWFCSVGAGEEPGSALVSVGGAVHHPGVFEIETGTGIASLVRAAGGATEDIRAFLIGGYAGYWISAAGSHDLALGGSGAPLGSGVLFALPRAACPVSELAAVARWLAVQSAGQCGPCIHGLDAIAGALEQVRDGGAGERALAQVRRWASMVGGRGACGHPTGVVRLITSGVDVFGDELLDHARRGPCGACGQRPVLPTPMARMGGRAA